jgi:SP family arabinose:H+ symporter-like MFS transporter
MKVQGTLARSTVVAALGGLLFGFDTAVISGATGALSRIFALTPESLGVTVASALFGTILGSMLAGWPGERYGRRDSLKWMAMLYFICAVGCGLAWDWNSLVFFRFIGGLAVGGSSVLGPMYISEIAPARSRGRLVGFFQFNIVFGILMAFLSNYVIGTFGLGESEWRWKLGVQAVPALLFWVMLNTIPRSPRWLASKGRDTEALATLTSVGEDSPAQALAEIKASLHSNDASGEALFQRRYRIPLFLAISIAIFNQLSGINAVLYYLNDIFAKAGFDKVSGDLQAVIVGATNLVFTMLAMSMIDKVGRKTLLLIGSVGTSLCLGGIAAIFLSGQHQDKLVWLLAGFTGFFAFSQGAVIWVFISEVFPNRVRAKGQSLGSFTHWFMNAIVAGTFPLMAQKSGGYPFLFFSAMMALQFFVVLFSYPETKGVTLEQMQHKLGVD